MQITGVETRLLEVDFPISFSGGTYELSKRTSVLCRISADTGEIGEVCVGNDLHYGPLFFELIRGPFKEILLGADPLMIEQHWSKMIPYATGYVDRDSVMRAISTIDITLWDLKGKICQQPVYKLIGGQTDRVPIIGIGGYYETSTTEGEIGEEIRCFKEYGLAGIKFKVGRLSLEEDAHRVQCVRQFGGDDFVIIADSNMGWTPTAAIRFAGLVSNLQIAWLEEPVHWRNKLRGLREVRQKTTLPIAAGQSEVSVFGCYDLLVGETVDVINITSNRGGGITAWLKIAGAAALVDVAMAHVGEPHISMHLMAGIPNSTFVECYPDARRDPLWDKLYLNRPKIEGGYIHLPDLPGLGLQIDPEMVEKFAVEPWQ
jgi:L-alanine-DL-glutamate epimerase-like enolase superfamily enzyme